MEDEKFPENSNSEIIDTGPPIESSVDPPVSNTGDPPDDSSLDRGSPPGSRSKVSAFFSEVITQLKQTTMLQRALVCLVVLALVISTATGVLIYEGSSGTTNSNNTRGFSVDGNCTGEIVYYPFYMISPMKLFYYYSVYDEESRQKGAAVIRGKSREDEGIANPVVLKAKNYKLKPDEYYGNTIAGYSDGTLVMTSNAMYTYRDANGNHLNYATKLEDHEVVLLRRTEKKKLDGNKDKKLSNHIVAFSGDNVNTNVFVGADKDKKINGINENKMRKHIFTNALYAATGDKYDSGSFYTALGEGKWKDVYKNVDGYKNKSFELWEAISRVEGDCSSLTLDPLTKINEYLSPSSDNELHNNYDGGDYFSDLDDAQKQMVRYHELDLLLSLYVIASENEYTNKKDAKCASTWEEVIEAYLKGWENPAEMDSLDSKGGNIVYDTLAISPAVGMIISGDEFIVPAADYVDVSLGLPSNVSIGKPSSANSFSFDCTAGNGRDYIVELCNEALKKGGVKPNGCPAFQKGDGKLGSLNLLQNVVGRYLSEDSTGSGYAKLKLRNDSDEPWTSFEGFKLTAHVWGSNLIHLNSENSAKFELPQFSVDLGKVQLRNVNR